MGAYKWITIAALFTLLAVLILIAMDPPFINEDDSAWDCITMGNLTCGGD